MKVIVTRANEDGSFDEVGMNNRMVVSDLKTENGIKNRAAKFAQGKKHRLEFFYTNFYQEDADKTIIIPANAYIVHTDKICALANL